MKLSMQQIEDSFRTEYNASLEAEIEDCWFDDEADDYVHFELPQCYEDEDIDDTVIRTSISRKELRNKHMRDRGEIVGHDGNKHRKW